MRCRPVRVSIRPEGFGYVDLLPPKPMGRATVSVRWSKTPTSRTCASSAGYRRRSPLVCEALAARNHASKPSSVLTSSTKRQDAARPREDRARYVVDDVYVDSARRRRHHPSSPRQSRSNSEGTIRRQRPPWTKHSCAATGASRNISRSARATCCLSVVSWARSKPTQPTSCRLVSCFALAARPPCWATTTKASASAKVERLSAVARWRWRRSNMCTGSNGGAAILASPDSST